MRDFYAVQLRISYDCVIVYGKIKCLAVTLFSLGLSQDALVTKKDFAGFLAVNYFSGYLNMYHHVQSIQLI